jgi:hypothetical protein
LVIKALAGLDPDPDWIRISIHPKMLDPDPDWIRISIHPKMLDPDPDEMNADPQPWFFR